MEFWKKYAQPPKEALKTIQAGRLKGKSDINPQWRLHVLTEHFGMCGVGWTYTVDKLWLEQADKEIAAFAQISLYVKDGGDWSRAIPGVGGSGFLVSEKSGLHMSDECYKMAITDALSVACKQLGIAANIYSGGHDSKYSVEPVIEKTQAEIEEDIKMLSEDPDIQLVLKYCVDNKKINQGEDLTKLNDMDKANLVNNYKSIVRKIKEVK
jgi:hypothetical protein